MSSTAKSKDDGKTKGHVGKVEMSTWQSCRSIEPALVIHMTAAIAVFMVLQDFMMEKACRVNLGFSDQVCTALSAKQGAKYEAEEKEVQKLISDVMVYRTFIENAFPIFLVFLVGAWSDKYGRKLPLLLVIFAFIIQNLLLIVCVYLETSTGAMTVAIVSSLIVSLSGNQACFMVAAFSYASDHTSVEKRTIRNTILHSSIFFGVTLGLAAGAVFSSIGFIKTFVIATGMETFALMYLLIMMKNHPQPGVTKGKSYTQILLELFDFQHIRESANSILKKREGNTRLKLWLLLLAHACVFMPMVGEMGVSYLACRLQFNWDGGEFGTFMAYRTILGFIANFVSMAVLTNIMKASDPVNGIVGCISQLASCVCLALATTSQVMYIAPFLAMLSGGVMIVPRSTISKIIPTSELGKVNSFIGSLESLAPLIASSMYTNVYKSFLDVLPKSFFLLSAAFMIPPILIHTWFRFDEQSKSQKKRN